MLDKHAYVHEEIAEDFLCREQTRNLFVQPDVIVIHEYLHIYRSSTANTPEIKLIAAVLEDAIDCYLKYCSAKSRRELHSAGRQAERAGTLAAVPTNTSRFSGNALSVIVPYRFPRSINISDSDGNSRPFVRFPTPRKS